MSPHPALAIAFGHAVPELAALAAPSLQWLLARSAVPRESHGDWRSWVLAQAGIEPAVSTEWPAGPCVRASIDGHWPEGTWLCATPVHLQTGIDHLMLAPLDSVRMGVDEAAAINDALRALLVERGLEVLRGEQGPWAIRWNGPLDCTTVEPARAVGRDIYDFMPSGPQGGKLRSLMNECQMLLHDHPVNVARASERRPAINALWLWGQGRLPFRPAREVPPLASDDAWLAGIWRANGVPTVPGNWTRSALARPQTIVASAEAPADSLESTVFQPLRELVAAGKLGTVRLLIGARCFELDSRASWRFWRRPRPLSGSLT